MVYRELKRVAGVDFQPRHALILSLNTEILNGQYNSLASCKIHLVREETLQTQAIEVGMVLRP